MTKTTKQLVREFMEVLERVQEDDRRAAAVETLESALNAEPLQSQFRKVTAQRAEEKRQAATKTNKITF